jgi:hypothetical protein
MHYVEAAEQKYFNSRNNTCAKALEEDSDEMQGRNN